MLKPDELDSAQWNTLVAASEGDLASLRQLLDGDPSLSHASYWYTPAIHFAVREGHPDAVRILLDAGAHPEANGLHDGSLIEMAKERGHDRIAEMLEAERDRRGIVVTHPTDHPIHEAAQRDDVDAVRRALDGDSDLLDRGDSCGGTPLHRAVLGGAENVMTLLLDRGADIHAFHGAARGLGGGQRQNLQAIDLALWGARRLPPPNRKIARLLVSRGVTCDLTVAAALGDRVRVIEILDAEPTRIRETRPSGQRPLSAAIESCDDELARLLLERGADPNWAEPAAPKGESVHIAARRDNLAVMELLLEHGGDPNAGVDSAANPIFMTQSPEIRALLIAHGGTISADELIWSDDDEGALRLIATAPLSAEKAASVFTSVCTLEKRDLLRRLLALGVRVPPLLTVCQTYLLHDAGMLRMLLSHGMSPDLMNWQHQTLLHHVAGGGSPEQAAILLDAGASLSPRDDEYRSTPLAWAARANAPRMVELLLDRGAPTNLADDPPWATALAWAERRGHAEVGSILRQRGAQR